MENQNIPKLFLSDNQLIDKHEQQHKDKKNLKQKKLKIKISPNFFEW